MLNKINRKYIIEKILNKLKKRKQLRILKYNKKLMNKFQYKEKRFQMFFIIKTIKY